MRKEFGEEPDLLASLRPCISTDTVHLEYISGFFYSVSSSKVILLFSFVRGFIVRSRSGYSRRGPTLRDSRVVVEGIGVVSGP